ncbi:MAG TPA: hypothetical protein VHF58_01390 [Solirubrobacterales bacterium]|nr:hypothetical protein [Solirubrobacterales bacterium]
MILLAALPGLALSACGDDDDATEAARPAPQASSFPPPDGRTVEQIASDYSADDLVLAPSGQLYTTGRNRFGFAVFEVDRTQVTDAEVALYAAPADGGRAKGPFPARVESLETEPAFTAETTAADPDAPQNVYVADVTLDEPGEWRMVGLVRGSDGEYSLASVAGAVIVTERDQVPAPGEKAPRVHTPTRDDVANIEEIDTRVPPGTMHEDDLADVLGKEPVVLLFATPALCQTRVCGPVVDVAEQVKRDMPDAASYIHMEIYEDNIAKRNNLRPQVTAYNLPTEPWLFVIDCEGVIDTRIEGAFSVGELTHAVERVQDTC